MGFIVKLSIIKNVYFVKWWFNDKIYEELVKIGDSIWENTMKFIRDYL